MFIVMIPNLAFRPAPVTSRERLLEAAIKLIRRNGFAATSVDQICTEAGVTKGAFFHHFPSKEALGVATADAWSASTSAFFAGAPYHHHPDPAERVLGYIDLRIALMAGPIENISCVAGAMVQETFLSSPAIRSASEASIMGNARALRADIGAALVQAHQREITAASLSRHIQAVIQGSFILAKASETRSGAGAVIARESLLHLRRYCEMLFARPAAAAL
jgi:TetR/AcrR family transcriptional repressor of nem operon